MPARSDLWYACGLRRPGLYCWWLVDASGISLIEGFDDAVVVTDASLTVVAWNGVMARLTGVAAQDALGRKLAGLEQLVSESLVVGDEPAVPDLIVALLGERGWRVDVDDGGRAAFERLREHRYEVVSDIRMPEGNGQELYRNALAHDADYGRRFIFVTGDTATPGAWRFLDGTDVPVVEKPFQPRTFEDAVYRVVSPA